MLPWVFCFLPVSGEAPRSVAIVVLVPTCAFTCAPHSNPYSQLYNLMHGSVLAALLLSQTFEP